MGGSNLMSAIAGRVLMLPKGNYDATTTYEFLDAVYYSGSTYICKQQTTGHAPTDTTYWQLMAQGTQSAQIAGNYYGTCTTASATANKVVTVPASENFVLQIGDIVGVRFTNTNTANNPTLNVNNSGAKPIYYNDDAVHTNYLWASGEADRDTLFMYDGTNWVWIAHDVDLDTDALADLTDTAISSPTNGQVLKYDSASSKWVNADNPLSNLSDANISSATNGQTLKYNGTSGKWENAEQSIWTAPVSCAVGDTTCTIQNANILTTSIVDYYTENASNKHINAEQVITAGQDVLTFDALEEATNIRLHIINL